MKGIEELAREAVIVLGTVLLAWPTAGLAQARTRETLADKIQAAAERDVTPVAAEALAARPEHYLGMRVQVRARVDDVHGAHALTLDADKATAGPEVLVLIPSPGPRLASPDTEVTVIGTVRPLMVDELKKEFDWFDLPPDQMNGLKRRPVIVADSVRTAAGAELTRKAGAEVADTSAPMTDKTPTGTSSATSLSPPIGTTRAPDVDQATGRPAASTPATALVTVTLTGCLSSAEGRPESLVLTTDSGAGKATASTRSAPETYRVEAATLDLKTYLGKTVRLTGVLARRGEPSRDVAVRGEAVVKDQATITARDLEPSPTLRATSVAPVADTCDVSERR